MYFLFSVVSSFMRCPHVQYTIRVLQCVRHALHCNFGSTSIISHSSVFPAAIIASFDSLLKGLNARCCWRSFWSASRWGWFSIFLNQVMNVNALRSFHHRIWHTGDVEIDVSVIHRKVELVRVITIFELTNFLHFVRASFHKFTRSIVILRTRFSSSFTGSPVRSEEPSSPCDLPTISWVTGFPRSIFNWFRDLGWAWKNQVEVLLQVTVEQVFQLADVQL